MDENHVSGMIWVTNVEDPYSQTFTNFDQRQMVFEQLSKGWKLGPPVGIELPNRGLYRPKNWFDMLLEWLFPI